MGADDNIHRAIGQPLAGCFHFSGWDKAAEATDLQREACKAL